MITKEHIISEIRRTAAQNGGKALGKSRFFAETGIREADWHGKYWVRWNDALTEAGLQANQLNAAIPEDELLRRLADLVRELGHFPVKGEFLLKARSDPQFPSHNTFGRFGGKRSLATRLRAYFLQQGEEALADLCVLSDERADEDEPDSTLSTDAEDGFVYLMKAGRYYKIGRTNAVGRRERELAIQLPDKPKLIHEIKTDDPAGIEDYWHKRFHDRRKNGEWFELTSQDIAAFRRRKFM